MAMIHFMGRPTKDPVMQQGKNSGAEYISLDIATTQRSQDKNNPYESVFYQCYFSKFLAERLIKAGVKSGTCLSITGSVDIHPFIYNKGQRAGQAGASIEVSVKDWEFCIANRPENGANAAPNGTPAGGQMAGNNGVAAPGAGNGQPPVMQGGGYMNTPGTPNAGMTNAPAPQGNQGNRGMQPGIFNGAPAPNPAMANGMYQQNNFQQSGQMMYNGTMPGAPAGGGFSSVPEGMAGQLPFN